MNILLQGYFDRNFGDDVMHIMIAEKLHEHSLFVYADREKTEHLSQFKNVFVNHEREKFDLRLYVIGTGFMYKGKRAKAEKIFSLFFEKEKSAKASAVINCSMEDFDSSFEERLAKRDIKKFDMLTCRDSVSFDYLKKTFPHTDAFLYKDMVFGYENIGSNLRSGEDFCGVVAVNRQYSPENYDYFKQMALFCDWVFERKGKKILLFAFDTGIENDVSAALSIKKMMKNSDAAEIVMYNSDVSEFAKSFARCDTVITSRFHGAVMAAMCGIKTIVVSDRGKTKRLSDELKLPCLSKKGFTCDMLTDVFDSAAIADIGGFSDSAKGHTDSIFEFIKKRGL